VVQSEVAILCTLPRMNAFPRWRSETFDSLAEIGNLSTVQFGFVTHSHRDRRDTDVEDIFGPTTRGD
jgi:hypothetical protein